MTTEEEAAKDLVRTDASGDGMYDAGRKAGFVEGAAWAEEQAKAKPEADPKKAAELVRSWMNEPGDHDERVLAAIEKPEASGDDEALAVRYANSLNGYTPSDTVQHYVRKDGFIAGRQSLRAELDRANAALARAEEALKAVSKHRNECRDDLELYYVLDGVEDICADALRDLAAIREGKAE